MAPSTVPRPMISAMCPRIPPKPTSKRDSLAFNAVPTNSVTLRPAASAEAEADEDKGDERFELDLDDQEEQDGDRDGAQGEQTTCGRLGAMR